MFLRRRYWYISDIKKTKAFKI